MRDVHVLGRCTVLREGVNHAPSLRAYPLPAEDLLVFSGAECDEMADAADYYTTDDDLEL